MENEIGELAAPGRFGFEPAGDAVPPPLLTKDAFRFLACCEIAAKTGVRLRVPDHLPQKIDRYACYIEILNGALPKPDERDHWAVGVLFSARGVDPASSSYEGLLDSGGLDVAVRANVPEVQLADKPDRALPMAVMLRSVCRRVAEGSSNGSSPSES
jgi:hypothetical protein